MTKTTQLASGQITNHDEITVILIEPTDLAHQHSYECNGRRTPRRQPYRYPSIASVIKKD